MNENIKRCLKERSKLTKLFYKNDQKREDKEKLEAKATYYTEQIMKAKNDYTQRMTNKLNDQDVQKNSYLFQRLLHFYQIHYLLKKFHLHQIQYDIQNISQIYFINNVNIYNIFMSKWNFILFQKTLNKFYSCFSGNIT